MMMAVTVAGLLGDRDARPARVTVKTPSGIQ